MINKTWKRVDNLNGHEPIMDMTCKFCGGKMFFRCSVLYLTRKRERGITRPINQISYKCPDCAWVSRFNVEDDQEYIQKVFERRGLVDLYVPPVEEWMRENEEIRKQLAALGYVGGMEV